jgi:hypothetical protein
MLLFVNKQECCLQKAQSAIAQDPEVRCECAFLLPVTPHEAVASRATAEDSWTSLER